MSKAAKNAQTKDRQPFCFREDNLKRAEDIIAKYPDGKQRSAVIPLLDLAQRQNGGWLSRAALDYVADFLTVPRIKVYEVATFYTMFNLKPMGSHLVQVCRTTPCWLRGSDHLTEHCKKKFGINVGEVTDDGKFGLMEVECLGACVNAPMVQINDDFFEDLTVEQLDHILDNLKSGKPVNVGTQINRLNSAPESGLTTLTDDTK